MKVSIIIPHYNDSVRLGRCLASLALQVDDTVEVIIADNDSTHPLEKAISHLPSAKLIIELERSAGLARNAGAKASSGDVLWFLDSDVIPGPETLQAGLKAVKPNTAVGGPVTLFDETSPPRTGAEAFETVFAFNIERNLRSAGFLPSGNLMLLRNVFEQVGGFRPGVSEDVEWSHRATAAGIKLVYEPSMTVAHPTRSDWPALERKWQRLTREAFLTLPSSKTAKAKWIAKAIMMPGSAIFHSQQVLRHPKLNATEKIRAIKTLFRLRYARMKWMLSQSIGLRNL